MTSDPLTADDIEKLLEENESALLLERHFPRSVRAALQKALISGIFLIFFVLFALFLLGSTTLEHAFITLFAENITQMLGLLSFFSALWLILFSLDLFSLSAHFGGLKATLSRTELYAREDGVSFELLRLLFRERENDNLAEIAFSSERAELLASRVGMDIADIREWITTNHAFVRKSFPLKTNGKMLLVSDILTLVYKRSSGLQSFFFSHGVPDDAYYGALDWTERIYREEEKTLRSWSRINLGEISGIAKDWAYGGAYALKNYAHEVKPTEHASLATRHVEDATEIILSQQEESNALLIGERGSIRDSVTGHLAERIRRGNANPTLEGRHLFLLDSVALTTVNVERASFERELGRVLSDSARAGNVILVIENIADFLVHAESLGVQATEVLDPFLSGDALQIIATATQEEYATTLSHFPLVHQRFEPVRIPHVDEDELVYILSYRALVIEARNRHRVLFTFQALLKTAELARTVLPNPTLPDDALDLLESALTQALEEGRTVITETQIEALVTERTGVPVGKASETERVQLLNLEEALKTMVVGQEDALSAVAGALRRARAGIGTRSRPLGSFLFLGPTGVGKTQVARALERALFERTDAMNRLDMTEFSDEDAFARLIGGTSTERGILEVQVTRTPYGILLLDEFEKSHPDVRNLFLQILEEGFYSTARGKRISLTNLVIIATSNAGSRDILNATLEHHGLAWFKDTLVKKLIASNVFRPELLNRFDDIILFEPLSKENLREIAGFELRHVEERMKGARIHIEITDELLDFIVEHGFEPEFGARPMRRVIQQTVEKILSEKILRGEATSGSTVRFTTEELRQSL